MKPRILGLTLLAALVLAGLWLARTGRTSRATAAIQVAPTVDTEAREMGLAAPPASDVRERTAAETMLIARDEPRELHVESPSRTAPAGGSIHGRVGTSEGHDPQSVWVRGLDELGLEIAELEGRRFHATQTSYRFAGLAPGRYWIQAGASGHRTALHSVEILAAESIELDIVLEPAVRVAVRVLTPDGEPHPDAGPWRDTFLPVATSEPLSLGTHEGEPWSLTWDSGVARFANEAGEGGQIIGFLDLHRELPVWVSLTQAGWVWASELVPAGSTEVVFTAPEKSDRLATLRVRAHDAETGERVSEAQVLVSKGGNTHSRKLDANALAEFASISPGVYGVTLMGRPFGYERRIVLVEAGSTTEFDLEIGGGAMIEGRLVDAAGEPLGNAPEVISRASGIGKGVYLGRAETAAVDRSFVYLTDEQGGIRIPVDPGLYLLCAHVAGAASTFVTVDARQGSVEGVEVRVFPPVAVVLRPEGSGGDARFRVLDADGRELEAGRLRGPLPVRLALAPGTLRLLVSDDAGVLLFETTVVATRETLVVPVPL